MEEVLGEMGSLLKKELIRLKGGDLQSLFGLTIQWLKWIFTASTQFIAVEENFWG